MVRACLIAGGVVQAAMAAFHATFPWLFRWDVTLACLANGERAIVYTFQWAMVVVLGLFAYASLFRWRELAGTRLGRAVALTIGLVWLLRAYAEVAYYRIGVDGSAGRLALFVGIVVLYAVPLWTSAFTSRTSPRRPEAGGKEA